MTGHTGNNIVTFLLALIMVMSTFGISSAQSTVSVDMEIKIERDCADSEAECIIRVNIPAGTTVGTLPDVIAQLQELYKDLWTGKKSLPVDSRSQGGTMENFGDEPGPEAVLGVDAIMEVMRAFHQVEEKGLSSFPESTTIISKEKFPLTIECLLTGNANDQNQKVKKFEQDNLLKFKREKLEQNLNYFAVTLVSFRSENNRFPVDLNELFQSGHVLIPLVNPFTNSRIDPKQGNITGNIIYSRPSDDHYLLTVFDTAKVPIRRELIVGKSTQIKGLLSYRTFASDPTPFNSKERTVRIYTTQTSYLLNSFYEKNHYLPDNIPHIESQGFSYVNFINPFTGKPAKPSNNIKSGNPGDYSYWRTGDSEYLLIGYGTGGRKIIEIHHSFIGNLKK
jgi:hypothetical protein